MADGVSHGQHRQTERERNAEHTNANVRKCRSKNCAPAPAKDKPERPEKLDAILFHFFLLSTAQQSRCDCRSIVRNLFLLVWAVFDFGFVEVSVPASDKPKRSSY
jgi:hypothetical protein